LSHIFNAADLAHEIIIDDINSYGTDPAYPNIDKLSSFIKTNKPDSNIEIYDDSIRITSY